MRIKYLFSVITLAGFISSDTYGQPIELKLAHVGAPGSLLDICAQEYARRVDEQLGGRFKIAVYGQSQLGSEKETLAKVKNGEITFTLVTTVMSSVADEFGVFELPFLVHNRDQIKRFRSMVFKEFLE